MGSPLGPVYRRRAKTRILSEGQQGVKSTCDGLYHWRRHQRNRASPGSQYTWKGSHLPSSTSTPFPPFWATVGSFGVSALRVTLGPQSASGRLGATARRTIHARDSAVDFIG